MRVHRPRASFACLDCMQEFRTVTDLGYHYCRSSSRSVKRVSKEEQQLIEHLMSHQNPYYRAVVAEILPEKTFDDYLIEAVFL